MPTYLLAFVISDLKNVQFTPPVGETMHRSVILDYNDNFELYKYLDRIYAREHAVDQTSLALESAVAFLNELESYVDYTYELSRMYHVALPDFAAGSSIKQLF